MQLINETSLAVTIDNISQAWFDGVKVPAKEQATAAKFIAAQQGLPGSYRGLFAPLETEAKQALTLFTGERATSWAGRMHILGEEALRVLLLLDAKTGVIENARTRAQDALAVYLAQPENSDRGMYCCGQCSVAVWRVIAAGGYSAVPGFAVRGVRTLSTYRDGKGRWRRFPFWYTVLVLSELQGKETRTELRYCAPALERSLKRSSADTLHAKRRYRIAQMALERI